MSNDHAAVLDAARKQGLDVQLTGGGHWKVVASSGQVTYVANTPSDYRALRNNLSKLRKVGLVWPPIKEKKIMSPTIAEPQLSLRDRILQKMYQNRQNGEKEGRPLWQIARDLDVNSALAQEALTLLEHRGMVESVTDSGTKLWRLQREAAENAPAVASRVSFPERKGDGAKQWILNYITENGPQTVQQLIDAGSTAKVPWTSKTMGSIPYNLRSEGILKPIDKNAVPMRLEINRQHVKAERSPQPKVAEVAKPDFTPTLVPSAPVQPAITPDIAMPGTFWWHMADAVEALSKALRTLR